MGLKLGKPLLNTTRTVDGVYRINDLYDEFDRKQRPEETAIDYFNHLVRIRSELLAAGEELKESRVSGKLIAGLRDEYSTVTDSVDQNDGSFTLATTRRWIQQAGKRVESRLAASIKEHEINAAYKAQFQSKQLSRPQIGRFRGKCFNCNKFAGHKANECPEPKRERKNTKTSAVAFPAFAHQRHSAFPAMTSRTSANEATDSDSGSDGYRISPALPPPGLL